MQLQVSTGDHHHGSFHTIDLLAVDPTGGGHPDSDGDWVQQRSRAKRKRTAPAPKPKAAAAPCGGPSPIEMEEVIAFGETAHWSFIWHL